MNLIELHWIGGLSWMLTLSAIFITILVLIGKLAFQQTPNPKLVGIIKQLGGFALAFGAFSTLVAFFQAFGDISRSAENIPWQVISGGLEVALITVLYGFVIFIVTQAALFLLQILKKISF